MCAAVSLREFIVERLTAAAADIFSACEQTIVRYEEEIDRQRRLLEISLKPQVTESSSSTDIPQQDTPSDLNHRGPDFFQISNTHKEPEPPLRKKNHEGSDLFQFNENRDPSPPKQEELVKTELDLQNPEPQQVVLKQECDESLLSQYSGCNESETQSQSNYADSGSQAEVTMYNMHRRSRSHTFGTTSVCLEGDCVSDSSDIRTRHSRLQEHCATVSPENLNSNETLTERSDERELFNDLSAQFDCDVCSKSFSSKRSLRVHKRTHNSVRPYSCDTCGEGFNQLSELHRHKATHKGLKPFSCKICGKRFSYGRALSYHTRVHTGEKLSPCPICSKDFYCLGSLKCHMRTHTGERPYGCNVCGKSYIQKSHLNQHVVTHTGLRPFHCQNCGKTFAHRNSLLRHQKTLHS